MTIAIVGRFKYHLECIGFLLEALHKTHDFHIYISQDTDKFGYVEYFQSIYPEKITILYDEFTSLYNKKHEYDKIIKLTSNDSCVDHQCVLSILHLYHPMQLNNKSTQYLSLTPYINNHEIFYTFPVFEPYNSTYDIVRKRQNIITLIGYYPNDCIDFDLIQFIRMNSDFVFYFIVNGSKKYPELKRQSNVKVFQNMSTSMMMNKIEKSKYILSKKHINYDRFSGQLGLALSFEIPLIIDKKTKEDYHIPGITFSSNYSEIGNLKNVTEQDYNNLSALMKLKKNEYMNKNKRTIQDLCTKLN